MTATKKQLHTFVENLLPVHILHIYQYLLVAKCHRYGRYFFVRMLEGWCKGVVEQAVLPDQMVFWVNYNI